MKNKRDFARIDVRLRVRFAPLDEDRAAALREEILGRPTVWAPSNEIALRDLATAASAGEDAMLAQAVLELAAQLVALRTRLDDRGGSMEAALMIQLSGGGGQLQTGRQLDFGDFFELVFDDPGAGAPPIRALGEVVHRRTREPMAYGFRFAAIHPADQDRLIRFLYQVQRQALREAQDTKS